MNGKRRRGKQKKRWEDNIKEYTGMEFASSTGQLRTGQGEKGLFFEVECGAPTTLQGYGID